MTTGSFAVGGLSTLQANAETLPHTETMPALFVGHGSPMNAVEENQFVRGFRQMAANIPKPKAILCISAHWFTEGSKVTAMPNPKTIHDFGGFPKELFEIEYPAPGNPELAGLTAELAKPATVNLDNSWGLDHGAWTVAMHMYPQADIPLVQLSVDRTLAPEGHFQLGQRLNALRQRGVLILGSGNIIHNLRLVDFQNFHRKDYGFDWAIEARQFVNRCVTDGNYKPLFDYAKQGPAMQLAVPTPEHYLPLLYILGLKHDPANHKLFNDEMLAGSLSMTSLRVS
ncbi:MAG: 4,5-DOPA dioxygenase extradiol [Planctomycetales bacterium]|nr:4,5-DOPA dioxygenase extradiol [Planctomycetales bacterium]